MKERGILFRGEMVRAILAGQKTVTRRPIKDDWWRCLDPEDPDDRAQALTMCPCGAPGDRLWVREAWAAFVPVDGQRYYQTGVVRHEPVGASLPAQREVVYRADGEDVTRPHPRNAVSKWRPSIFMPRWASRLTLEVTGVAVERVQDITEEQAEAEGVQQCGPDCFGAGRPGWVGGPFNPPGNVGFPGLHTCNESARDAYSEIWDAMYAGTDFAWERNPWAWAVAFRRAEAP